MAKFRKVHTAFWDDPLMEKLSPDARYFYLFLMTNPLCTECGIYEITIKKMCNYTGYNEDSIKALIRLLEVENSRISYDYSTEEVCILKKPNYIENTGKPVLDCIHAEFTVIKNKNLIFKQVRHIEKKNIRQIYETWYASWYETYHGTTYDTSKFIGQEEKRIEENRREEKRIEEEEAKFVNLRKKGQEIGSEIVQKTANEAWGDQAWREQMCMGLNLTVEELKIWLARFNSSVASDSIPNFSKSTYKKMSRGWIISRQAAGEKVEVGINRKSEAAPLKVLKNGN